MAQRYGGDFSPQGKSDGRAGIKAPPPPKLKAPTKGRARLSILMGLSVIPVVTSFFTDTAIAMAVNLAAAAVLFAGAVVIREGVKAHNAWSERKVARRPAVPRKAFGAVLVGIGVTLAAMTGLGGIAPALLYGAMATALGIVSFGLDPMKDKGMEGIDAFQTERVARTIEEAQGHLDAMKDAVLRARDREAESRVDQLAAKAQEMFRAVEDDPRDLTAARKYLGVYLMGARDAAAKFADVYSASRDDAAKTEFFGLLDDLERGFDAKRETLLITDRTDLEVEIEVLRDRLKRDGLPTGD